VEGYFSGVAYPERIVPEETPPGPLAVHEARYRFALPYCAGREVLDAACGVGYGSALLATEARRVVGVDLSAEAIEHARSRYGAGNLEFRMCDVVSLDLQDASFDAVCSFETIEHLPDPNAFLGHVARVLREDGVFIGSTPQVAQTNTSPDNPFHTVEYDRGDFEKLLGIHFQDVELLGQRRLETRRHRILRRFDVLGLRRKVPLLRQASRRATGTSATQDLTISEIAIDRNRISHADVLVCVCRRPRPT
jgi:SAM-dependent methyltransferase